MWKILLTLAWRTLLEILQKLAHKNLSFFILTKIAYYDMSVGHRFFVYILKVGWFPLCYRMIDVLVDKRSFEFVFPSLKCGYIIICALYEDIIGRCVVLFCTIAISKRIASYPIAADKRQQLKQMNNKLPNQITKMKMLKPQT